MDKLVSVIVPVYNVEKYLRECIDSILKQTYINLEIILIDDGSADKSGEICDSYIEIDKRIKVIHKENGGLSEARNVGLDVCTGDIISFIDSDDYISTFFIEIMMKVMNETGCDIVALVGGTEFWDGDIDIVNLAASGKDFVYEYYPSMKVLAYMLYQKIATGTQFKIYRKHVFENIRFPKGYLYEDVATTYKAFFNADKAAVVSGKLYAYRKRKDSIIRQAFSEKKLVAMEIFDQLINDEKISNAGLSEAAASRGYAMLYSVFLQIPEDDIETQLLIWKKLSTVRKTILLDKSRLMRKKNKYAAFVSLFGMKASYRIGRRFGQKGSMN